MLSIVYPRLLPELKTFMIFVAKCRSFKRCLLVHLVSQVCRMNIKDRYNCAYFFLESHRNVEKVLIKTVAIIAHKQSNNRLRVETVA